MSKFPPPPPVIRTPAVEKHSYKLVISVKNKSLENVISEKMALFASELMSIHSKLITKVEVSKNES